MQIFDNQILMIIIELHYFLLQEKDVKKWTVKIPLVLNTELASTGSAIARLVGKAAIATSLTNKYTNAYLHALNMASMIPNRLNAFAIDIGQGQTVRNVSNQKYCI